MEDFDNYKMVKMSYPDSFLDGKKMEEKVENNNQNPSILSSLFNGDPKNLISLISKISPNLSENGANIMNLLLNNKEEKKEKDTIEYQKIKDID